MKSWGIAVAGTLTVFALALLQHSQGDDPGVSRPSGPRVPVLLIHGSGLDSSSWIALIAHLRMAGWPPEYLLAPDLVPNNGPNIPAAISQLHPAALRLLDRASVRSQQENWPRPEKIAIVAHSMGAVSGRWLAARLIPDRVAAFIAIAGANHGSDALCDLGGQGNDELCPAFPAPGQSFVLEQLNGTPQMPLDETPYGPIADREAVPVQPPLPTACIAWHAVFIQPDEWIIPTASARLAGAGGTFPRELPQGIEQASPGEYRLTLHRRHDDMPSTLPVMRLIESLLLAKTACPVI